MAELVRKDTELFIKEILTEYARKIRSVNKNVLAAEVLPLFNPRMDAFYKLVTSEDMDNHIFSRLNEKGMEELTDLCRSLAELYELRTTITNSQVQDAEKFYSFHDGVFYIDARNTGVTISQIFKDVFGTTWEQDSDFYMEICHKCLGIDKPNKISGEYKVNLKFDGNDETTEDNEFGRIMRNHYISELYINNDSKKTKEEGFRFLKNFDEEHGTKIIQSESRAYSKTEDFYNRLVPESKQILDKICGFLNTISVENLILKPNYINFLFSKAMSASKKVFPYIESWLELIKKIHFEDIDKFALEDYEIMALMKALSKIRDRISSVFLEVEELIGHNIVQKVISDDQKENNMYEKYINNTYIQKFLGFHYLDNGQDFYYTVEDSFQSKFGFMDFYDKSGALIGMKDLQDITVVFPYKDKEYRVEFWYGPYGFDNAYGAEIGLYSRPLSDALEKPYKEKSEGSSLILYQCLPEEEQLRMVLFIDVEGQEQIRNDTAKHDNIGNGTHFWNLAIRTTHLDKDELASMKVTGEIFVPEKKFRIAMCNALCSNLYLGESRVTETETSIIVRIKK